MRKHYADALLYPAPDVCTACYFFAEIGAIDPNLTAKWHLTVPISGLFGWFGMVTISPSPWSFR